MRSSVVTLYLVAGWLLAAWAPAVHAAGATDVELAVGHSEACYWLSRANLGRDADYEPGVDAYGREVVSADMNQSPIDAPEFVEFALMVDFADDLPSGVLPVEGFQSVAMIRINTETGEMFIDGEAWEDQSSVDIESRCANASSSSQ